METMGQIETLPPRSVDDRGKLIPLTPGQWELRKAAALKALDDIMEIGDEAEHRETLEFLIKALVREPIVPDEPVGP